MSSSAVRLLIAAAAAAGLTLAAYVTLPESLDVRTDIVGFPTFANFNIDRYFWLYGLAVGFLPVATLALYLALTRIFVGKLPPVRPLPTPSHRIESIPEAVGWREWVVSVGRTFLVGGVFGVEAVIVVGRASDVVVTTVVTTMLAYGAGVVCAGWLAARLAGRDRFEAMSVVNTLATPFLIAGLWSVSRSTELTVTSSGEVHGYPWLPAWVAFGITIALFAYFVARMRRARSSAALGSLERCAVLLVAAPLGLFVVTAALPGELGTFGSFEEGQALGAGELVQAGAFPWRDFVLSHGLLFDVGRGLFGTAVFEDSYWGFVAGDEVLLIPLAWVTLYYLCAYLFWSNWLYLLGTQLVIVCGHITAIQTRMLLVPLAFLLLAALLRRPNLLLAAAFTAVLVVQIIVTPEALVVGAASLATLVAFEFLYHERGRRLAAAYPRTIRCLAVGAVILLGWAAFLAAYRALDDWAFSFAATIPGHRLTGGIESFTPKTSFEVAAPIVAMLFVFAFMASGVRLRRRLLYTDWLMVAMAGFTLLYFSKFLSRADSGHLDQSFAAAVPLLFYVVYRVITFAEARLAMLPRVRNLHWFPRRHTLTLPLLAVLLLTAPEPLHGAVRAVPGNFRTVAGAEPEIAGIGYTRSGENDPVVLRGLEDELSSLLEPGDTVFDFSNAPGVFHYLLDERPSTPYYHVSYAIRRRTQTDLLDHLRASRPAAVVLTSAGASSQGFNSLPSWDGIVNAVRHYDVSEYLLDHYVPVRDVGGFVVMARRDRGARADSDLYFHHASCDWGYVPSFFTPAPAASATSVSLPFRRLEPMGASGRTEYTVTIPDDAADYRWLEIRTGDALREGDFELADRRGLVPHDSRVIFFKALDRGEAVLRVKIGSCPQWRGYRPGTLYFSTNTPQDIREIRLVERAASAG